MTKGPLFSCSSKDSDINEGKKCVAIPTFVSCMFPTFESRIAPSIVSLCTIAIASEKQ